MTESDDVEPGAHPFAVLSNDYWTRRFGQDSKVIGRTFRLVNDGMGKVSNTTEVFQVVGVVGKGFTGTEPGTITDIFLPTTKIAQRDESLTGAILTLVKAGRPDWYNSNASHQQIRGAEVASRLQPWVDTIQTLETAKRAASLLIADRIMVIEEEDGNLGQLLQSLGVRRDAVGPCLG